MLVDNEFVTCRCVLYLCKFDVNEVSCKYNRDIVEVNCRVGIGCSSNRMSHCSNRQVRDLRSNVRREQRQRH